MTEKIGESAFIDIGTILDMSIKELKVVQEKKQREIAEIETKYQDQLHDLSQIIDKLKKDRKHLSERKKIDYFQSHTFEGWEETKKRDLRGLTLGQLDFLIWKRYGIKLYREFKYEIWRTDGGHHRRLRTSVERRSTIIQTLEYKQDCRFCHSVTHEIKECPKKAKLECEICDMKGHTASYCRTEVRSLKCSKCGKFGHILKRCTK